MGVTFAHLFRKPTTVCYPDVNVEKILPDRYRGILDVDLSKCVSCKLCVRACPVDCIIIEDVKCEKVPVPTKDGSKKMFKMRAPVRFEIDIGKCMFCGFCQEACPTAAIHHTKRFTGCVTDVNDLIYSFVEKEEAERLKKAEEDMLDKQKKEKEAQEKNK
jgi:formate hydrogenlyase subunit 6/NADH:ubiquinone oxidoreductase subunit I